MKDIELNLHGYTVQEAMETFVDAYNRRVEVGNLGLIEVIHGYGSTGEGGRAISTRLRNFLKKHPESCEVITHIDPYDAKTVVYPKKKLPERGDSLAERIIDYCASPKTVTNITGKFRRFEDVEGTVTRLVKEKILVVKKKGKYKVYETGK